MYLQRKVSAFYDYKTIEYDACLGPANRCEVENGIISSVLLHAATVAADHTPGLLFRLVGRSIVVCCSKIFFSQ